ncbi:hypothetical protein RvY_01346, partial [Ramazzottius varieornatus]
LFVVVNIQTCLSTNAYFGFGDPPEVEALTLYNRPEVGSLDSFLCFFDGWRFFVQHECFDELFSYESITRRWPVSKYRLTHRTFLLTGFANSQVRSTAPPSTVPRFLCKSIILWNKHRRWIVRKRWLSHCKGKS